MGQDVFLITATGDGKSTLIYVASIARKGTITLVVAPTNALQTDMVSSLAKKSLSAIAINTDTLAEAALKKHNLWEEAATGQHQIVLLSPEKLRSTEFDLFIHNNEVRQRLAQFVVDEAHLVDEWGVEFCKAYAELARMRAYMPSHTVFVALTATCEPGAQTQRIIKSLGFTDFQLIRRDCERRKVDLIIREVQHTISGYEFRDLDWLVQGDLTKASDGVKTLLYAETIEMGHR